MSIEEEIKCHTERLVLLKDMLTRKQERVPCKTNQHYLDHITTSTGYVKVDGKEYWGEYK